MTRSLLRARWSWLFASCLATVWCLALFKLPFLFPPQQRLVSPLYQFGFNNSVAIIAVVLLLGVATRSTSQLRRPATIGANAATQP